MSGAPEDHTEPWHSRLRFFDVTHLPPAYFGMVMATGIVSLAAEQIGFPLLARGLFLIAIAAYLVLWCLTIVRLLRHRRYFFADMTDHLRGPGFFTMVAASGILGSQRSEEHTSELQSREKLVCRLLLEKKKNDTFR